MNRSSLDHFRVELLVPATVERGGDVQSLPIQTELQHLGAPWDPLPLVWITCTHKSLSAPYKQPKHLLLTYCRHSASVCEE